MPDFARGKSEAGARGDLVWLFDWVVGEVMATLEKTGQAHNTLVIVTSDNGALPGDFVLDENGHRVDSGTGRNDSCTTRMVTCRMPTGAATRRTSGKGGTACP